MVAEIVRCPFCQQSAPVVRFGYNRCGTARCRCKACARTFTPKPVSRAVTPEKEQAILAALSERLSVEAVARLLKVSKVTIYKTLKKSLPDAAD
jgi:transposase